MKNLKNNLFCNILQYILVIIIILECNSIYSQIYGYHLIIRSMMTVIASVCIFLQIVLKKIRIYKSVFFLIIYDILCSIIMFINTDNLSGKGVIVLDFLLFLPLMLIYLSNLTREEFKGLLQKFINVVIFLSIVSLVFWISILIFKLKPTGTVKLVWAQPYSLIPSYFNLYFNTQDVWWLTGTSLMRNTGIFAESPMYAVVLIVALIFNNILNFENTKLNLIKTAILFITIVTTISVTGVVCSIIIIAVNTKKYILKMKGYYRKFFIFCLVVFIICMIPIAYWLLSKKMNTSSANHRNMDIKIGTETFFEKPLIGHGINHEKATELEYEIGYGYSNAIIPVMTDGGIFLTIIYVLPIIVLAISGIRKKNINYLIFTLIYTILLFTTLIQYRLIMMLLISISYCMAYNNLIEGEKYE